MDILTHVLSGFAAGTAAASISGRNFPKKIMVALCGAAGAALPDLDAASRWSGFDRIVGRLLGLAENGREIYFANHWYSHRNATHSIAAALLAASALMLGMYAVHRITAKRKTGFTTYVKGASVYGIALFAGYMMHLLGDLPTPASGWGGIKLFWPLPASIGGWGEIWWWNNYDIFLAVYACCVLNILLLAACKPKSMCVKLLPAAVFVLALTAAVYQIQRRPVSFASGTGRSYNQLEEDSLRVQRDILGGTLYGLMKDMDKELSRAGIIF